MRGTERTTVFGSTVCAGPALGEPFTGAGADAGAGVGAGASVGDIERTFTFGRTLGRTFCGAGRTFTFGWSLGFLRAFEFAFPFGAGLGPTFSSGRGCASGERCTLMLGRTFGTRRSSMFGVTACAVPLLCEPFTAAGASVCGIVRGVASVRRAPRVSEIGSGATGVLPLPLS